jgi:hypothetical protein
MFTTFNFHYSISQEFGEEKLQEIIKVLNNLTPCQLKAVEIYARSRYLDGEETGWQEAKADN